MYLTHRDVDQLIDEIFLRLKISIQSAAYTVYRELTPATQKPMTQREFHVLFKDNWKIFGDLEDEENAQNY